MINETGVYFFPGGGHDHDGESASLIDTNFYSIFDFPWTTEIGGPDRKRRLENNYNSFKNFIITTVNDSIIRPAGIFFQPGSINASSDIITNSITTNLIQAGAITADLIQAGTITATQIAANTITANEIQAGVITGNLLNANVVLVNQAILSNNYVAGVSGWKIDGGGTAEFDAASIRGTLTAAAVSTPGVDIFANGVLAASSFVILANGAFGNNNFDVDASGNLTAINADISGEINSNVGSIGGWTLNNSSFSSPYITISNSGYPFIRFNTQDLANGGLFDISVQAGTNIPIIDMSGGSGATFIAPGYIQANQLVGDGSGISVSAQGTGYYSDVSNLFKDNFGIGLGYTNGAPGAGYYIIANNDAGAQGKITTTTPSDRRYKSNIENVSAEENNKIYSLMPRQYILADNYPVSTLRGEKRVGLVADEVEGILPEVVLFPPIERHIVHNWSVDGLSLTQEQMELYGDDPDKYEFTEDGVYKTAEYSQVDYSALVPRLVGTIVDLNNRLKALESYLFNRPDNEV